MGVSDSYLDTEIIELQILFPKLNLGDIVHMRER